ncbi:enoyl-CoA hydratase/isomerase family protein [Variovorax paradoxus]|nr:enoyl-CoA hydratase-related protein [Variovorax paradoxus]MBT2304870.1 enoyl-CoA hydratase/isomerase family protein [Variovorax paradoxus]
MARVALHREGAVGHVRISNRTKRNAMSLDMWRQLEDAVLELDGSADIRVIVIAGDGDEAFASGADIRSFEVVQSGAMSLDAFMEIVLRGPKAIRNASKPVIASIDGVCMGAGMEIAAACDVRFASSRARFRIPASLIGLGFQREIVNEFVQLMGRANVADILLSARAFAASEARTMGFVNQVVDGQGLQAAVSAYAQTLSANAPLTLQAAKAAIRRVCAADDMGGPESDRDVDTLVAQCYRSADFREGLRAFFEKRKPVFVGG